MFAGAISPSSPIPLALSGALSASGSTVNITGSARTVTVLGVNPGVIRFANLVTGSGTPQYKKNAGSFTTITEGLAVTFANGDTLQVQGTTMTAATITTFDAIDNATGLKLEAVQLQRT